MGNHTCPNSGSSQHKPDTTANPINGLRRSGRCEPFVPRVDIARGFFGGQPDNRDAQARHVDHEGSQRHFSDPLIEARYGRSIARIRQEIKALCLTKPMAAELKGRRRLSGAEDDAALPRRRRHGLRDFGSIHPADRFTFAMELNRSRG